ncbi:MAG: DNA-directed RNA polymerase subunit beta [Rickettsiales bacterium]
MALFNFTEKKRIRKNFSTIKNVAEMPNLLVMQKNSYNAFLQADVPADAREDIGIHGALKSIFPISDLTETAKLEYISYVLDEPKYDVEESKQRGINYCSPLKVTMRMILWDEDEDTGVKEVKGIKEQEVFMGDVPLMTDNGTFIINGTERVIVSQMHRSPGVFFDHDNGKVHSSGKFLYSARIIPYRGSWLDFEFDVKDLLYFRIDRRRKILVSSLLYALGYDKTAILSYFYSSYVIRKGASGWVVPFVREKFKGTKLERDLVDADTNQILAKAGEKLTARKLKLIAENTSFVYEDAENIKGLFVAKDIVDAESGEVILDAGGEITEGFLDAVEYSDSSSIEILNIDNVLVGGYIRNSIFADKNANKEDALLEIYKVMRPGEPTNLESAEELFHSLFFTKERYDLSLVGRMKINSRLHLPIDENNTLLTHEDILASLKLLANLRDGIGNVDDIDHLGNRRVRSVGELVENQLRIGLVRMERTIVERMSAVEIDSVMPHDLVNAKVLTAILREFFGLSQLSQFMDQTNPLSEITHKRRLSALGPGGLTRDRAGFEVRDVHTTHYGRICPIETPEGPNIGLINSLSTFAKINKYGFIESPFRKVTNGQVTNEVVYLSAIAEEGYIVAQSNAELDVEGYFKGDMISCRQSGEFVMAKPSEIDLIDVTPMQIVSVAASLVPFLENDDANRALMGANMQRQAVPLLRADAPLVGTGMESIVARDSGAVVVAKADGVVDKVDARRIVVRSNILDKDKPGVDIYNLLKFQRTNQNTSINQRPIVKKGDVVKKGDIIADGPSTDIGELALGRNVLVAFMPWNGYNYEDSILISERIVSDDVFTSIHVEEFEVVARDTRIGPEEITRDIPNIGEEGLRQLDEVGIVHVGAEVKSGDILVGKVTPKSESPITPEEKLLRAIFGEKAADVRDTSLRVPPGITGTVLEVRVFSRRGIEKDERAIAIEQQQIRRLAKDRDDELKIVEDRIFLRVKELLEGEKPLSAPAGFSHSDTLTAEALAKVKNAKNLWQFTLDSEEKMEAIADLKKQLQKIGKEANQRFKNKVEKLQSGDDLPQGALKVVKVFLAVKRKLQPGDKMAGRHGNKGVISRIASLQDMPFLEDGTPVDIVLNPLGVPSRMNIGQIMETHLGWASAKLGAQIRDMLDAMGDDKDGAALRSHISDLYDDEEIGKCVKSMNDKETVELAKNLSKGIPFATPVFEGAKEPDIERLLKKANLSASGQERLIDGRTGQFFERPVTVGYIYILKLHHLVDDKIHARSIGPYSLVTQQPLGGKSHFGGQRFGEMECWALQAYGASYTLQEMLTVKSDDVAGRIKIYESIVRGDSHFESGIPESFHVMIKELRSLCLNISLEQSDEAQSEVVYDANDEDAAKVIISDDKIRHIA